MYLVHVPGVRLRHVSPTWCTSLRGPVSPLA